MARLSPVKQSTRQITALNFSRLPEPESPRRYDASYDRSFEIRKNGGSLQGLPDPTLDPALDVSDKSDLFSSSLPPTSNGLSGLLRRLDPGSLLGRPGSQAFSSPGNTRPPSPHIVCAGSSASPLLVASEARAQNKVVAFSHDSVTVLFAGQTCAITCPFVAWPLSHTLD